MIRHVFIPPAPAVRPRFWLALWVSIILLACSIAAHADTVTGAAILPTTNTNGTAIPATGAGSLTQVAWEYGTCSGAAFGTKLGEQLKTPPANTATFDLGPGTYCFRVRTLNTYGRASDWSDVVSKTIDSPTPGKSTITVTVTISAVSP